MNQLWRRNVSYRVFGLVSRKTDNRGLYTIGSYVMNQFEGWTIVTVYEGWTLVTVYEGGTLVTVYEGWAQATVYEGWTLVTVLTVNDMNDFALSRIYIVSK